MVPRPLPAFVAYAAGAAGACLLLVPSDGFLPASLGALLLVGVAVPVALSRVGARRGLIVGALLLTLVPLGLRLDHMRTSNSDVRHRTHDGGVLVTRAAAEDMLHGRNPYRADYSSALPERWQLVAGPDGTEVVNPIVDHYPYLPAAALVHVPFVAVSDALDTTWDPRLLGVAILLVTLLVVARRPEPQVLRAAAIVAIAGPFTILFLSWGTNDAQVGCLLVLACLLGAKRPEVAGVALALAVACKFPVLVMVPPLVWVVAHADRRAIARWWTFPAVLGLTTLPFLVAGPSDLIEDTVAFNFGLTDVRMPVSGIGLPVAAPDVFHGATLAAVTLLAVALAALVPLAIVRRTPRMVAVPPAAAIGLLALLVPARTFQEAYLTILCILVAPTWFLLQPRLAEPRLAEPRLAEIGR